MADTATLEQAHDTAVQLDAELAVVAALTRAAVDQELLQHNHPLLFGARHECPACQLTAWSRSA